MQKSSSPKIMFDEIFQALCMSNLLFQVDGIKLYDLLPSPAPPASLQFLQNLDVQHGVVSSVDLDTRPDAPVVQGNAAEPKPSVQALVHMEADGRIGATEAAMHALIMTHNLELRARRLRVSFLSGDRHVEK